MRTVMLAWLGLVTVACGPRANAPQGRTISEATQQELRVLEKKCSGTQFTGEEASTLGDGSAMGALAACNDMGGIYEEHGHLDKAIAYYNRGCSELVAGSPLAPFTGVQRSLDFMEAQELEKSDPDYAWQIRVNNEFVIRRLHAMVGCVDAAGVVESGLNDPRRAAAMYDFVCGYEYSAAERELVAPTDPLMWKLDIENTRKRGCEGRDWVLEEIALSRQAAAEWRQSMANIVTGLGGVAQAHQQGSADLAAAKAGQLPRQYGATTPPKRPTNTSGPPPPHPQCMTQPHRYLQLRKKCEEGGQRACYEAAVALCEHHKQYKCTDMNELDRCITENRKMAQSLQDDDAPAGSAPNLLPMRGVAPPAPVPTDPSKGVECGNTRCDKNEHCCSGTCVNEHTAC